MKRLIVLAAAALFASTASHAVKFNPDAMQKMQQEGKKIANEALTLKTYRLSSDKCLTLNGDLVGVGVADCNGSPNQNWRFTEQGQFVNETGRCLGAEGGGVAAADCADAPKFKWSPGAKARVSHSSGGCLTAAGDQVNVAPCNAGANQQWR
jgi:hypothetical protein